ncbi:MAG: HipA N-terminal domain-containing protein [Firmicutes bacterium]|nr:HipA N-terminal domain-containing protein [Bacillota bacterium]
MAELRKAKVLVQGRTAGFLAENDEGYSFRYDDEYIENGGPAVSLTLPIPKGNASYQSKTLFPFFDGLIPEGWLLDIVVHNWKLSPDDRFGLLLAACKDCIGDVSVVQEVAR